MLLETIGQAQLQRRCRRQVKNDATADRLKAPMRKISAPAQHAGKRSKMWLLAFETTAELPPQRYAETASDKPWYKDIVLSSVTHISVNCSNTRSARDRGFEDLES